MTFVLFHHLPNPTMEYRPDMRIVIVDDDGVAEGMTGFFPGFQWFSTGGKVLSEELMTGIPGIYVSWSVHVLGINGLISGKKR